MICASTSRTHGRCMPGRPSACTGFTIFSDIPREVEPRRCGLEMQRPGRSYTVRGNLTETHMNHRDITFWTQAGLLLLCCYRCCCGCCGCPENGYGSISPLVSAVRTLAREANHDDGDDHINNDVDAHYDKDHDDKDENHNNDVHDIDDDVLFVLLNCYHYCNDCRCSPENGYGSMSPLITIVQTLVTEAARNEEDNSLLLLLVVVVVLL